MEGWGWQVEYFWQLVAGFNLTETNGRQMASAIILVRVRDLPTQLYSTYLPRYVGTVTSTHACNYIHVRALINSYLGTLARLSLNLLRLSEKSPLH